MSNVFTTKRISNDTHQSLKNWVVRLGAACPWIFSTICLHISKVCSSFFFCLNIKLFNFLKLFWKQMWDLCCTGLVFVCNEICAQFGWVWVFLLLKSVLPILPMLPNETQFVRGRNLNISSVQAAFNKILIFKVPYAKYVSLLRIEKNPSLTLCVCARECVRACVHVLQLLRFVPVTYLPCSRQSCADVLISQIFTAKRGCRGHFFIF